MTQFEYPPSAGQYAGSGFGGAKTLWVARPGYDGRILIRGAQLDGPNEMRFSLGGGGLLPELAFAKGQTNAWSSGGEGWRQFPSATRLRAGGCYVFQIDTENMTSRVYFRAVSVPGFPTARPVRNCSSAEASELVRRFVDAFNAGRTAQLDRLIATGPAFKWYSVSGPGARLGQKALTRSTLVAYLRNRHALGERLRLTRLSRGASGNGYFHFSFQLRRVLPQTTPRLNQGKGAAVCTAASGAQLAVWSVGGPPSG
jgi:hypothetical protein